MVFSVFSIWKGLRKKRSDEGHKTKRLMVGSGDFGWNTLRLFELWKRWGGGVKKRNVYIALILV
jgi:hypothetical protein